MDDQRQHPRRRLVLQVEVHLLIFLFFFNLQNQYQRNFLKIVFLQ